MSTAPRRTFRITLHTSNDILAESIDQAVHSYGETVKRRDVTNLSKLATFIINTVIDGTERATATGVPSNPLTGSSTDSVPSLEQWSQTLDALCVAVLPRTLGFLEVLYKTSKEEEGSDRIQEVKQCSNTLVNLCFLVQTTYTFIRNNVLKLRDDLMQLPKNSEVVSFLFTRWNGPDDRRQAIANVEKAQTHLIYLGNTLCETFSSFFPLIMWNAESQIRHIKKGENLDIKGFPNFVTPPPSAQYLSKYDDWLWLLVVVILYSPNALPLSEGKPSVSGTSKSPNAQAEASSAVKPLSPDSWLKPRSKSSVSSPPGSTFLRSQMPSNPNAGSGPDGADTGSTGKMERKVLINILHAWGNQNGGSIYVRQFLSVILSSIDILLKLWVQRRGTIRNIFLVWVSRAYYFPENLITTSQAHALVSKEDNEADLLDRIVKALDDLVVFLCTYFCESSQLFSELLLPLGTVSVLYLLDTIIGKKVLTRNADGHVLLDRGVCSRLMAHIGERILERATHTCLFRFVEGMSPDVSTRVIQVALFYIAAECLDSPLEIDGPKIPVQSAENLLRKQRWRSWSLWINTAHYLRVLTFDPDVRPGDSEEAERTRKDVLYVQSACLAMEEIFSLFLVLGMYQSISTTTPTTTRTASASRSVLTDGASMEHPNTSRVLGALFEQLRWFLHKLHEEHRLAMNDTFKHLATPVEEGAFNAMLIILNRFCSLTASFGTSAPSHRSSWLLCLAFLRLSDVVNGNFDGMPRKVEPPIVNFMLCNSRASNTFLRDQSYTTYDEWAQCRRPLPERFSFDQSVEKGEVKDGHTVLSQRVLFTSIRFAAMAVYLSSKVSFSSGSPLSQADPSSQPKTYFSAYKHFLLMTYAVPSSIFIRTLQTLLSVWRRGARLHTRPAADEGSSLGQAETAAPQASAVNDIDTEDVSVFRLQMQLFSL